jgi:hypothetical protein
MHLDWQVGEDSCQTYCPVVMLEAEVFRLGDSWYWNIEDFPPPTPYSDDFVTGHAATKEEAMLAAEAAFPSPERMAELLEQVERAWTDYEAALAHVPR